MIRFGSRVRIIGGPFLDRIGKVGSVIEVLHPTPVAAPVYEVRFPREDDSEGVRPDIKFYDHEVELAE